MILLDVVSTMPKLLQEFMREDECTATLQDGCRQLESRRIDVWRL